MTKINLIKSRYHRHVWWSYPWRKESDRLAPIVCCVNCGGCANAEGRYSRTCVGKVQITLRTPQEAQ